jgi:ParB/RepB/Spo0J family partition protein
MNTFTKHFIDIELSCIEMTFAHIRIAAPLQVNKLTLSIDACGQVTPVIVVSAGTPNRFTLMDGYLRIAALQRLKQDIVKAEIWECSEADALLSLIAKQSERQWEAFEEASALRELQARYQLSQEQIANQIGRTQSWISRRLALLTALPDKLVHAVTKGTISVWTANRVLAPMARAIPSHSECLLNYLNKNSHSTRELTDFFKHYQKTNYLSREKMVMQPELFFKAQKALQAERQAKLLKAGPEGRWRLILANISDQIKYLEKLAPQLFYDRQEEKICQQLLEPLDRIQNDLNRISTTSRGQEYENKNDASNHYHASPVGQELPAH